MPNRCRSINSPVNSVFAAAAITQPSESDTRHLTPEPEGKGAQPPSTLPAAAPNLTVPCRRIQATAASMVHAN